MEQSEVLLADPNVVEESVEETLKRIGLADEIPPSTDKKPKKKNKTKKDTGAKSSDTDKKVGTFKRFA